MMFPLAGGIGSFFRGLLALAGMLTATAVFAESPALPFTNRQVAEQVVARALEDLRLPEGNGAAVRVGLEGNGQGRDMLEVAVMEHLAGHGYRVGGGDTLPEFRFGMDTLYVSLEREGGFRKKQVRRLAEARIGAVFRETPDARKNYQGRGIYDDAFPSGMLDHVGRDASFVVDRGRSFAVVRPILFGLAVTGLIWLLYSYRG